MKPDWHKSPAGATHWMEGSPFPWLSNVDEMWSYHDGYEWRLMPQNPNVAAMVSKGAEAWCGVGLPPVGTVCEANMPPCGLRKEYEWRRVEVAHGGLPGSERELLVFDLEETHPAWVDEFRPLRTPEQIAAEERERAVLAILADMPAEVCSTSGIIGWMLDQGYRKAEGGAQ